jgi:ATP-dependent DNA helicase RecG
MPTPDQLALPLEDSPLGIVPAEEIYRRADQALLTSLREDRRLERKAPTTQPAALADYISMWANTVGGGLVVLGMENDGRFSGCSKLSEAQLNRLECVGADFCPDARCTTKRVPVVRADGVSDFVLLIKVAYRHDKVVFTVRREAFIRYGDTKRALRPEEIRELEADKGQIAVELEPCGLPYPAGFDVVAIQHFVASARNAMQIDDRLLIDEVLELRHLGRREVGRFVPNTACALLFANDPVERFPGCKIRFLRFDGEHEGTGERFNAIKDITLEGSIPRLITSAEQILEQQLRDFSRLGPDNKFYTAPEYPKPAWYEAVVNATVHRSYGLMRNMNIFIKMFDNRLVIESPGGFPPPVTAETVYEMHQPRNPHLMEAMRFLEFVKCAREGTRRMRDSMKSMHLPAPEFEQKEVNHVLVRITLRNNIEQRKVWIDSDASKVVGEALARTLGEDELRAINFVAEHGRINASQVQRLTGRSWPRAHKLLMGLADRGILVHVHRERLDRDPQAHFVLRAAEGTRPSRRR